MQTLTVSDPAYMVGDSSPSTGYNAGQFGNGELDNADVNNAIYASVGIRVPPDDSDIYSAMDVWPPDSGGRGGDGLIQFLDWQTILARSLGGVGIYPGLDTNNYIRFWTNGDNGYPSHQAVEWFPGGPPVTFPQNTLGSGLAEARVLAQMMPPPGSVWFCQASIGSGTVLHALPGNVYSLPVYVNVSSGYSLAGLQFRTIVTAGNGAPSVVSNWFSPVFPATTACRRGVSARSLRLCKRATTSEPYRSRCPHQLNKAPVTPCISQGWAALPTSQPNTRWKAILDPSGSSLPTSNQPPSPPMSGRSPFLAA
jgi:hypothetical protein